MKFHSNFFEGLRSLKFVARSEHDESFTRDPEGNKETNQDKKSELNNNNKDDEDTNGFTRHLLQISLAEILGTFMLMFFGCISLVSGFNQMPQPPIQPALMFGFIVSTVIVIFGHVSRAHLNPAVTTAALVLGEISLPEAFIYVISQCIGAILGYVTLGVVTPADILTFGIAPDSGLCMTIPHPAVSNTQAFLVEFLATCLLVLTCCGAWDHRNAHHGDAVPIKFALVVTLCSVTMGPYTGASMNPARSLAPAFVNGIWTKQWIYWTSPFLAGIVAPFIYMRVFERQRLNRDPSSSHM